MKWSLYFSEKKSTKESILFKVKKTWRKKNTIKNIIENVD